MFSLKPIKTTSQILKTQAPSVPTPISIQDNLLAIARISHEEKYHDVMVELRAFHLENKRATIDFLSNAVCRYPTSENSKAYVAKLTSNKDNFTSLLESYRAFFENFQFAKYSQLNSFSFIQTEGELQQLIPRIKEVVDSHDLSFSIREVPNYAMLVEKFTNVCLVNLSNPYETICGLNAILVNGETFFCSVALIPHIALIVPSTVFLTTALPLLSSINLKGFLNDVSQNLAKFRPQVYTMENISRNEVIENVEKRRQQVISYESQAPIQGSSNLPSDYRPTLSTVYTYKNSFIGLTVLGAGAYLFKDFAWSSISKLFFSTPKKDNFTLMGEFVGKSLKMFDSFSRGIANGRK